MNNKSALRVFKISVIILMTLLCFACRKPTPSGKEGELTTNDVADPADKTTGAVDDKGLPYAGYNAGQEISALKNQIEDTEENKSFAQEIEDAHINWPKTLNSEVQTKDAAENSLPLELKVQWKGITAPLDFQGNLTLANGSYKSNLVETSGQRPDLNMTAECTDMKCAHGNFFVFDPNNRKAGIVVTNENRSIKFKTLADPITPTKDDQIPDELKKDQKVNISSMQVINGVSKFEIRDLDQQGQPADVEYSGELVLPNGECPQLKMTNKASDKLSSLCLKGYTGTGDLLLKGELKQPDVPASAPTTQNTAAGSTSTTPQSAANAVNSVPPPSATAQTGTVPPPITIPPIPQIQPAAPIHQYIYFESTRAVDTPEQVAQQQSGQPSKDQCPVIAKVNIFLSKIL